MIDSSDEPIQKKNEELAPKLGVKYHYEERRRLAVARNTGIRISSGDIVVFADDDFIVDKDWISKLIKNFEDPEVVCCTGRTASLPGERRQSGKYYKLEKSTTRN